MIYDTEIQQYFAARDAVGTRPLYYTIQNNKFYYSDDIGELFVKSKITKEPNINSIRMLMYYGTLAYDETLYRDIKRLPPGHHMIVDKDGNIQIERYWKPEDIKIDMNISEEEAKDKFLELFDQAILERIDDISTTAFDLSGGLDSSSVVSMIKRKYPDEKVHTVSMEFGTLPRCDEGEYIDAMNNKYELDINKVNIDNLDYTNTYNLEYNYKLDPYWPILVTYTMRFPVAELLKEMNIKRVLTGQGGDQVLGGNKYALFDYAIQLQWIQLYRELKASTKPINMLKKYIVGPLLSQKQKKFIKSIFHTTKLKKQKIVPEKTFQEIYDTFFTKSQAFNDDLKALVSTSQTLTSDSSASNTIEKCYGIEFSHPFFDRRLIEFMLSLPAKFKYREGVTKVLLRKAMKDILPEKIRQRRDKAEFTAVVRQQIDVIDLDELLDNAILTKLGLIEQSSIDQLKDNYRSGKMKTVAYFWKIINMEYWYRYNFVDQKETIKY